MIGPSVLVCLSGLANYFMFVKYSLLLKEYDTYKTNKDKEFVQFKAAMEKELRRKVEALEELLKDERAHFNNDQVDGWGHIVNGD